ncbi:hypothetical protein pb186bvf_007248 [Paramecium bursaria]
MDYELPDDVNFEHIFINSKRRALIDQATIKQIIQTILIYSCLLKKPQFNWNSYIKMIKIQEQLTNPTLLSYLLYLSQTRLKIFQFHQTIIETILKEKYYNFNNKFQTLDINKNKKFIGNLRLIINDCEQMIKIEQQDQRCIFSQWSHRIQKFLLIQSDLILM